MDDKDFYMQLNIDFYAIRKLINAQKYCGKEFNNHEILNLNTLPSRLKEFHLKNNGFGITWQAKNNESLFGGFKFIPLEEVYEDYRNHHLYEEEDIEEDPLIENFRPFDEISPEVRCGFIDIETEDIKSIYLHSLSNLEGLQDLDIDFDGYVELMKMCWAYNNWPYILLYLKKEDNNVDEFNRLNKELVDSFKRDMPKVFKDFNWDAFIEKYQSLRLSKMK